MESPVYANKGCNNIEEKLTYGVRNGDKMNSSINSNLDDTTPSDSGVQMLDSEASELMVESITSQIGFEFEEIKERKSNAMLIEKEPSCVAVEIDDTVDTNSNVTTLPPPEDLMTTSTHSTFDTTENIVYRRKVRKAQPTTKAPKKRVSFHEDILKNTRTDNIHIEHGFITYKSGRKIITQVAGAGRYSWCSDRDGIGAAAVATGQTEVCAFAARDDNNDIENSGNRRIVYRNACSDVLDYGNSDIYDTNESKCLQYDNSGVFEYQPKSDVVATYNNVNSRSNGDGKFNGDDEFCRCSCSSSNSSIDSEDSDKNLNPQQYEQAKSRSCDCIGINSTNNNNNKNNNNNNVIGQNCYFSEPNIDNIDNNSYKKSVWNKEKKPKTSCLKKSSRQTNIIQEQDLSNKVKKFNVHDMNQLFDNSSKVIFGSLKSIFTMPLPERGVPEGSEDLQAVIECVTEVEQIPDHKQNQKVKERDDSISPPLKVKPFLSKSLDGTRQQQGVKKFVHNVDEQLRRKKDEDIFVATKQIGTDIKKHQQPTIQQQEQQQHTTKILQRQEEIDGEFNNEKTTVTIVTPTTEQKDQQTQQHQQQQQKQQQQFRNKFIINCESTVFEHTGVSYCYETNATFNENTSQTDIESHVANLIEKVTPIAQPEPDNLRKALISTKPITKSFTNFFRSFKENATSPSSNNDKKITEVQKITKTGVVNKNILPKERTGNCFDTEILKSNTQNTIEPNANNEIISTTSQITTSTGASSILPSSSNVSLSTTTSNSNSLALYQDLRNNMAQQSRHIPSPLKKRVNSNVFVQKQPPRYGGSTTTDEHYYFSPSDHFNSEFNVARSSNGRDSKSTILSEEFDDILTITTDTDKNESDIVIVDYPEVNERQATADYMNLLRPPQPIAKTSLINRFLRNVTQKKIIETSMRKNNFFSDKLKSEQKLFSNNLYVRGAKPKNYELIDDLNAEIAMEIEMSGANSPRRELTSIETNELPGDVSRFELGIGEISIDIFNGNYLHILRDPAESLLKVFKLYTGYSREGYMTPVLVFLTDKTLYVADLIRNRLCSKFILDYVDLDVILMGPYGNTVLLSNSARDMQQVLLAGGPYPADALVANLELCARRSGSTLPAVGQLMLEHLAPLQAFVRHNSTVEKCENWMYYAVVNVPAGTIGTEKEPLGPHVKGFLMHRRVKNNNNATATQQNWNPGYFLLKAGVLYMFNDSCQKIPSWAMALAECQGACRSTKAGRPHCFEILLKSEVLQLAAPDEYVASEWLQAILQAASGLFEMQDKHKTLGCTLVVTQNHLLTIREDFTTPLRKINKNKTINTPEKVMIPSKRTGGGLASITSGIESSSLLSSIMSTPTGNYQNSVSSINSTPTKLSQISQISQISQSTTTYNTNTETPTKTTSTSTTSTKSTKSTKSPKKVANAKCVPTTTDIETESYINMSSVYGKHSGVEVLTCADIKEMTGIKIPSLNETWWCILEFSCQEVCSNSDDLIIFFASSSEMQRFLRLLEQLWQSKNNDLFPISILDEDDYIAEHCTMLYMDINRSWEPLLSAALGFPL